MTLTHALRSEEAFDEAVVLRYLKQHLYGIDGSEMHVEQFSQGHSNLTYLIRCGSFEAVLRRPPLGPVAPKAHDMVREFHVLEILARAGARTPKPLILCQDDHVLGVPFYVMERVRGVVFDQVWPDEMVYSPETARQIGELFIESLVELHALSTEPFEEAGIGHPDGYMRRQVDLWLERHRRLETWVTPSFEKLALYLQTNIPETKEATLIHNDFKLNNLILSQTPPIAVCGIVDWEMATVGDPLSDLAISLSYWAERADPPFLQRHLQRVTTMEGFPSRRELIQMYAKKSGRDVSHMKAHLVFAYVKTAGICQQIYDRYRKGQTSDARFKDLGALARALLEHACSMMQ